MSEAIEPTQVRAIEKRTKSFREQYDAEALNIIRENKARGATDLEFAALMTIAAMKNLNPMTGQIHFVKRKMYDAETRTKEEKWVPQVGIDGFRLQAARTGQYDGQDEIAYEYDDKKQLAAARCTVYRKGSSRGFPGYARFEEYVQTYFKDGKSHVNAMWSSKPHVMLGKCAEAQALRKAFPEELGDLYIPEELDDMQREEHSAATMSKATTQMQPQTEQRALPARTVEKVDWAALVAGAQTPDEIDSIGARIDKSLAKGTPERKAVAGIYKARRKEIHDAIAAEKKKTEACEVCGLVGDHASDCPEAPEASVEPAVDAS